MKKVIKLKESELKEIVESVLSEQAKSEGVFEGVKNLYRGINGVKRGFGMEYFKNMSELENLMKKLKKLDEPNVEVMKKLSQLKTNVQALNMPQQRKDVIINLIDNSVYHFNTYNNINDRIIAQIKKLNLDSWN